jgi:hypothetical protein
MNGLEMEKREAELPRAMRKIRATWSLSERRRRAEKGYRKTRELGLLIASTDPEPDIWAVGAPMVDDVRRLAG